MQIVVIDLGTYREHPWEYGTTIIHWTYPCEQNWNFGEQHKSLQYGTKQELIHRPHRNIIKLQPDNVFGHH